MYCKLSFVMNLSTSNPLSLVWIKIQNTKRSFMKPRRNSGSLKGRSYILYTREYVRSKAVVTDSEAQGVFRKEFRERFKRNIHVWQIFYRGEEIPGSHKTPKI